MPAYSNRTSFGKLTKLSINSRFGTELRRGFSINSHHGGRSEALLSEAARRGTSLWISASGQENVRQENGGQENVRQENVRQENVRQENKTFQSWVLFSCLTFSCQPIQTYLN